jgi:pyruvate dehydrogenase E1 component alpha subunit
MKPAPTTSATESIPRDTLLQLLRRMLLIREFEGRVASLFAAGELPGFVHLYIGQEAIAAGVCATLNSADWITSTHRGHGHLLAKGGDPRRMMAELFGKVTGYCKGKGGSMHIADPSIGILGANGIVGAGIPIAVGAAMTARTKGTSQVAVAFFGDGASNEGTFAESLNLASMLNLPVLFVCENNGYAVGTPYSRISRTKAISDRAAGYGLPGVTVDGNDVLAVYAAASEAVARARNGEGPTLIEARTFRWRPHFEGEPDTYRTRDEVAEWRARDPILRLRKQLINGGLVSEAEADAIADSVRAVIDDAVEYARESPLPLPEEVLTDVYA